jgi:hypothetical protein
MVPDFIASSSTMGPCEAAGKDEAPGDRDHANQQVTKIRHRSGTRDLQQAVDRHHDMLCRA